MISKVSWHNMLLGIYQYRPYKSGSGLRASQFFKSTGFGPATILSPALRSNSIFAYAKPLVTAAAAGAALSTRDLEQLKAALTALRDGAKSVAAGASSAYQTEPEVSLVENTSTTTETITTTTTVTETVQGDPITVLTDKTYAVDVAALATGQRAEVASAKNTNKSLDSKKSSTGELRISFGSYDAATNSFTANGSSATVTVGGVGSLQDIASAINNANIAVYASITQSGTNYKLSIASTGTGKDSAFKIEVTRDDADANLNNAKGLSEIIVDPTTHTTTQDAQDAEFTVDGVAGTSGTNVGVEIAPGVTTDFSSTGVKMVTVQTEETVIPEVTTTRTVTSTATSTATSTNWTATVDKVPTADAYLTTNAAYDLSDRLGEFVASLNNLGGSNIDWRVSEIADLLDEALNKNDLGTDSVISTLDDIGIPRGSYRPLDTSKLWPAIREDGAGVLRILTEASEAVSEAVDTLMTSMEEAVKAEKRRAATELDDRILYVPEDASKTTLSQMARARQAQGASAVLGQAIEFRAERWSRPTPGKDTDSKIDDGGVGADKRRETNAWTRTASAAAIGGQAGSSYLAASALTLGR